MSQSIHSQTLTPAAAATFLSVSQKHLRALREAGELAFINIGLGGERLRVVYDRQDLEDFKQSKRELKCQSPSVQGKQPTATTSTIKVIDFQAKRV